MSQLFRSAALERLSTPEQLDRLVRVTRPMGWFALLVFGFVCTFGLIWSTSIVVPVRVAAQGMLVAPDGVSDVMTEHTGRVAALLVQAGDKVQAGQEVARLDQPDAIELLQQMRMEAVDLDDQFKTLQVFSEREALARKSADDDRRIGIRQGIAHKRERIGWLEEKIAQERDMVVSGFISKQRVITSQIELNSARSELAALENELKQLDAQKTSFAIERLRVAMESETRRNTARRKVAELQAKLARQMIVRSPYDGQVAELKVSAGELVESGSSLFSLQRGAKPEPVQMAVIYVAPEDGKRIVPGLAVQISPSNVKREEFGFILGRVKRVAEVPSTAAGMMRVLKNKSLQEKLSGKGAPFEVWVELETDPGSVTGFRWSSFNPLLMKNTSGSGPAINIGSNTLCTAQIMVREKRLITMLVPGLEPLFANAQ